jgi:hypothetical protein
MNQTIDYTQLPLRDIHLPGAISWWPPAFGWWLLAALVLVAAAALAFLYYRGRHRRAALLALKRVRVALEHGSEPVGCLQQVSTVLRRFAMTSARLAADSSALGAEREADVAGLIGRRWLEYLDGRWQRDAFTRGAGQLLLAAPYARPHAVDRLQALELTALCNAWLQAQPTSRRRRRARRGAPPATVAEAEG